MRVAERTFTPGEAAFVSGVPVKTVNREIDEGPLNQTRKASRGKRSLREEDLFYLAVAKGLDTKLVQLTAEGKQRLHNIVVLFWRRREYQKRELPLFGGGLSLDLTRALDEFHSKLIRLERASRMIVEDPEIRGGEPCFRGTRIGVYEVTSMLEKGASKEEILEGYPSLKPEYLELGQIFAQAYPRKGRPPRHPWHQSPWHRTSSSVTRG